ncbi:putative [histone H3]-lysine(4) N-trimethyltransferase [Helianthus anomalus]
MLIALHVELTLCCLCESVICPENEVLSCSTKNCNVFYRSRCESDRFGISEDIKCPQHTFIWRCSRCDLASHEKGALFFEYVISSKERYFIGGILLIRHLSSASLPCSTWLFIIVLVDMRD